MPDSVALPRPGRRKRMYIFILWEAASAASAGIVEYSTSDCDNGLVLAAQ